MPNNNDGFYWDSCVFLAYLNGEEGRDSTILNSFTEIIQRKQKIYTSTIAIVEAAHKDEEKIKNKLNKESKQLLEKFWNNKSLILVEVNPIIARNARDMIREGLPKGFSLSAKDAVHIATANFLNTYLNHSILEFHTYDQKLKKYQDILHIPIKEPYCQQFQLI
jgi:predicted nucleic acid-binding protein